MSTIALNLNETSSARLYAANSAALNLPSTGMLLLLLAVLMSAFAVVYVKDYNRRLFNELESLQQTRDTLRVEAGQLLLEEKTWAAAARVETIAAQDLAMELPQTHNVAVVNA